MDSQLGWESSLWSNQQNGVEESFLLANSYSTHIGKNMDLPQDHEDQQIMASSSWGGDAELMINPILMNGLIYDHDHHSIEYLDCLLSATTSITDTTASLEDDHDNHGISMIFSNINNTTNNNLWRFGASSTTISSSVDSHKNIKDQQESSKPTKRRAHYNFDHHLHHSFNNNNNNNNLWRFGASSSTISSSVDSHKIKRKAHDDSFNNNNNNNNTPKPKKPRASPPSSSNINFQDPSSSSVSSSQDHHHHQEPDPEAIAQMKEMIYRAAAFRPVSLGMEVVERPKRKNVKISSDPQTVAARQRRERISERIRVLQKLVPGGSKMDTASMLDEAANYLKFLRSQVKALENLGHNGLVQSCSPSTTTSLTFSSSFPMQTFGTILQNPSHHHHS